MGVAKAFLNSYNLFYIIIFYFFARYAEELSKLTRPQKYSNFSWSTAVVDWTKLVEPIEKTAKQGIRTKKCDDIKLHQITLGIQISSKNNRRTSITRSSDVNKMNEKN